MPSSVLLPSYNKISQKLSNESEKLADVTMKEAAECLVKITMGQNPENVDVQDDGTVTGNVAISIDGTWQKR